MKMPRNLHRLVSLFTMVFFGLTAAQIPNECPRAWVEKDSVCYHFVLTTPMTVQMASVHCQEKEHSSLLTVKSATEHAFIRKRILSFNATRMDWLTSGVRRGSNFVWEADGSEMTQFFFPSDEVKGQVEVDPQSKLAYNRVVYRYNGQTKSYDWAWGRIMTPGHFVCKLAKAQVWRFYQQQRDFSFGTNDLDPKQWPTGPKFRTRPMNTVFFKSMGKDTYTPVTLECDASGNPSPTYKWYRARPNGNKELITSDNNFAITNGVLLIAYPNPDNDVSSYTCEAENKHGKILSNEVRVSYGYVQEFSNVQSGAYRGVQYKGLEMDCNPPNYKPDAKITWFKESVLRPIRPKYNPQMFISKNGLLYISEVTPGDEGEYFCQVILSARPGEKLTSLQAPIMSSKAIVLRIEGENANTYGPDIQDKFPRVFPKHPQVGQRMEIECIAYGRMPMQYRWMRLDAGISPAHHVEDHGRRLIFDTPRLEDSGLYACIVSGVRDTVNKTVYVKMSQPPTFPYPLRDQFPDIGSPFTWTCNAVAVPIPTYSWYKDSVLITSDNQMGITVDRNRLHFASIDASQHNGMYQCQASVNDLDWRRSSAQLHAVAFAPSFAKSPLVTSVAASVNGQITIKCRPEAAPRPEVVWTHNGGGLNQNARQLPNGDLEITELTSSDAGSYTCTATNRLGEDSSSTTLNVVDETVLVEKPDDNDVVQNGTIDLRCKVSFNAKTTDIVYAWKFNDHPLDFDRELVYDMPNRDNFDGTLYITGIQYRHEGDYTCDVTSSTNTVSASAFIGVDGPPSEPAGVHVKSASGQQVELWWQLPGQSHGSLADKFAVQALSVTDGIWFDIARGIEDENAKIENYPDWRSYVIKDGLYPGTHFQFRVSAHNQYGYGPYSTPSLQVKTDDAAPIHFPPDVGGGGGSEQTLTIDWTALPRSKWGSGSISYNVFYRLANGSERWQAMKGIKAPPVYKTIYKDLYYLPYEVKVQAENPLGPGPNSSVVVVHSAERMPTKAPTDVQVNAINNTAGWISWTPVPNTRKDMGGSAFAYQVNYWEEPDTKCPLTLESTAKFIRFYGDASTGLLIGLPPGGYVCVTVQFMNHAGLGPKTDPYSMGMNHEAPRLYPRFVTITSHGEDSVRVTWQGVKRSQDEESVLGYKAWVWNSREDMRTAREIDFGNVYTGVVRGIEKNAIYKLRVLAYSWGGEGTKSPDAYFTLGGQVFYDPATMELMNSSTTTTSSVLALVSLLLLAIASHLCL